MTNLQGQFESHPTVYALCGCILITVFMDSNFSNRVLMRRFSAFNSLTRRMSALFWSRK
jgi:hypothetical protein